MTVVVLVLLGLLALSFAGALVQYRRAQHAARREVLTELANVAGIDVMVRVGETLGWIREVSRGTDGVRIRVR